LNEKQFKGRTILLDLAFEKKQFEKFNQEKKANNPEEKTPIDIDEEENNEETDENKTSKNIIENEEEEENEEENEKNESLKTKEEEEKQAIDKKNNDENLENTVFVTNLPYEITENEFRNFANNFGSVQYARVFFFPFKKFFFFLLSN